MNKVINYWQANSARTKRGMEVVTTFSSLKNNVGEDAAMEYLKTVAEETMADVNYVILIKASLENPTIAARLLANQRIINAGADYQGWRRYRNVDGSYATELLQMEGLPKIAIQDFYHLHPVKQAVLEVFWQHGELGPAEVAMLVNKEGYNLGKLSKLMPNYAKGLLPRMVAEGLLEKVEEGLYVAAKLI